MDATNKTHAKDYLLDYKAKSTTPLWLASLIQKCIDTNGKPSDSEKDDIFAQLLQENHLESPDHKNVSEGNKNLETEKINPSTNVSQQKLVIKKITHVKGVNALIPNQSITFSPACTVIFGLNGTGKSGYFRILHEIAGGIKHKNILNNVRELENGLEVDVEYLLDGSDQNYKWKDKHTRGVEPFDKIKVFDSEYLPIFLNERESSVNIEPLGLNLFQIIASVIDDFKGKLEVLQNEQENLSPDLQPLVDVLNSEELKFLFQGNALSDDNTKLLAIYTSITKEEIAKLAQLKQQKQELEKQNTGDSKKVLNQEKTEIELLNSHLTRTKSSLESVTKQVSESITDYVNKKKIRDERAKEFEVLGNVPSQESDEWQSFVESAEKYGVIVKRSTFNTDEKCIYCHQPLGENALKLVKAYSEYLNDQSQENFRIAANKINILLRTLENLNLDFEISENLKTILVESKTEQDQGLNEIVNEITKEANKQKAFLIKTLEEKGQIGKDYTFEFHNANTLLSNLATQRQQSIDGLEQSATKKQETIAKLDIEIEKLEDKQNISKWKTKIETYFNTKTKVKRYRDANDAIVTTGITVLGSKAHDELLTDSIRKSFEDELKAMGKDVEVTLKKTGAGKGTVRTCLKVLGNDVEDILSTGEQKAVCLALFLGEVVSQGGDSPIIFDDPVTSVDHEVAELLAKRLLQISTNRQVVIFTHDKLFYDSLVYWGGNLRDEQNNRTHHVCRNYIQGGCNSKGCHIYTYTIRRVAKDRIGRVSERQNECCSYFVIKAEQEMKGSYAVGDVAGHLKSAIEHYIDEKMLKNQGLLKDRERQISIQWDEIKKISIDISKIDQLKDYWDKLSNRGSHLTQNSVQNPLEEQELNEIISFLKA